MPGSREERPERPSKAPTLGNTGQRRTAAGLGDRKGERRIVQEHRNHGTGKAGDRLDRLVADLNRVAALLRASRRPEPPSTAEAWRSSYAAQLWALAETAERNESAASPSGHLTLVDEDW